MAMQKPRLRLIAGRPVSADGKPHVRILPKQAPTNAEKLSAAKRYLRERGIYVLDRGAPAPKWGVPGKGKA